MPSLCYFCKSNFVETGCSPEEETNLFVLHSSLFALTSRQQIFTNMIKEALLLTLSLCALASCTEHKKDFVIAVSSCSSDMWREKLNEEMNVSTYLYDNVKLEIQSANDDDKRQIEQINNFVEQGVDLLIVSPNQYKTISPAIDRAYGENIPVVLFDRKTDTDKYTAYIGADNFTVGKDMGEYVARLMHGRGSLVVINGLRGSSAAIERDSGFMSVIRRYPDIRITGTACADWFYGKAFTVMDSLLDRTTDIDCVFAQNDRMAMGARRAVEAKGITRHIDYVGVDALPVKGGGLECVRNGLLTASYIYPTRGDLVIALAMNILQGKPFKRDNPMHGALVTRDNAGVLILQYEELSKQRSRLYTLHDKVDMYLAEYSHQRVYATLAVIIIVLLLVSFTLIYRSVVTRRRIDEEAADAKLVFFTSVSHEFRTPLTLIADPVDRLLADSSLNENQHSLLRLVRKNADIMLRLVDEILDFRKVQKGKMPMRVTRFCLSDCLAQWTEGFRPAAGRKNVTIETGIAPGITVSADYDKLEKTVYNLLSNALKYTPDNGTVSVSARTDGSDVLLTVADNGCGISPEDQKHIFDRFYQTAHSAKGTGIGLALVRAFTEMHHGSVSVKSSPGQGAVFTVRIPQEQPDTAIEHVGHGAESSAILHDMDCASLPGTEEPVPAELITSPEELSGQKPVVLIIDDNADVRSYIAVLLKADYSVIQAADGTAGLERATKEVPDIIICDVMMPGTDGLTVCRRLKAETATSHIPVIMLTARTMEDQRTEGYDCGADAYITKPFSGKVLAARVRNLLETRRQLKSIYGADSVPEVRPGDADSRFISEFRRIVMEHLSDSSLSVEDISSELGLSRVQMYRKVKALTGSTPVELVRVTRLKRAELLLRQKGRTVSEVSYEVGFSSPSYFAKCFKEYFGRLPSE